MSSTQLSPEKKTLFIEGFTDDPYACYRPFMGDERIHLLDWGPGVWAVFNYAESFSVLKDPRLSSKRAAALLRVLREEQRAEFAELGRMVGLWMLFMDPPEHWRLRKLMNKGFSPAAIESLRPQVEAIVDRLLKPLEHATEAELMKQFAHALPVAVIAELLGIPAEMTDTLAGWSDEIATFLGNPQRTVEQTRAAQTAVVNLTDYFRASVAKNRSGSADLIQLLLEIEEDGETLTEEELYAQCVMLLFGGHETTRNLIGNAMLLLLQRPNDAARLRDQPNLIRTAVEEFLRYESPVQYAARITKEDTEVCGVQLRAGQVVAIIMGAANRDGKQFKDADRLDLGRLPNPHLALGAGAHFCIGNQIARMEGQTAILRLIQKFPQMRMAREKPEWSPNPALRGLNSLPVLL